MVVLFQSAEVSVFDATYFGRALRGAAIGSSGSVTRGQCAAKISYVLRPSRNASASAKNSLTAAPKSSSQKANDQPPCSKPPEGSSVGPPGACITPSRVRKV